MVSQLQKDPSARREVDLEKHIESHDEDSANFFNKKDNNLEILRWPKKVKDDYQVRSAYLYLKSIGKYSSTLQRNN